ncbi:hypothetical protein N7540_006923 [Penicillium herquei]|nr:hypothetical protein N7540_006923 [Penicillium herquei]
MLLMKILPVFAIAGMATAAPFEERDLEARAVTGTCASASNAWCCTTAFPFTLLFIKQIGSNCVHPDTPIGSAPYSCANKAGKTSFLCCAGISLEDKKGGVICT